MGSRSHVEHDFLGMEINTPTSSSLPRPRLDRRQSFRGISKINPEIVRSVLASASKPEKSPGGFDHNLYSHLPLYQPHPFSREGSEEKVVKEKENEKDGDQTTAPMTIFYNGSVSVFDLPKEKAESVIKFVAEKSNCSMNEMRLVDQPSNVQTDDILDTNNDGDLPIKRKKSLQRFFEKRKERLISVSPYLADHVSHLQHKALA